MEYLREMVHAGSTSRPFLPPAPSAGKKGTVLSIRLRASLDRKRGFGESAKPRPSSKVSKGKDPSKQQEPLQGAPTEPKKAIFLHEDSKELQSVIKSVEKDYTKKHTRRLNIDKEVAAKGKVDFVKVESWGDEGKDQSHLESLKVKSFSPAFSSRDSNGTFYERLVHRLQLLESKGEISVVHAKNIPPFQNWAFGEERYLQYLVDQHSVFHALRMSIANITRQGNTNGPSSDDATLERAALAVKIFDNTLGLDRSEALQADIESLSKAMVAVEGKAVEVPKPTTQTTAYVKYLRQLAGASGAVRIREQGYLQLLAHIFALYVTHLTTGMRIGAKALDCLPVLKQSKGVNFFGNYPQHVKDPLKVFIAAINRVADLVPTDDGQEVIMEELPKAIQKTSLLLVTLAVTELRENKDAVLV